MKATSTVLLSTAPVRHRSRQPWCPLVWGLVVPYAKGTKASSGRSLSEDVDFEETRRAHPIFATTFSVGALYFEQVTEHMVVSVRIERGDSRSWEWRRVDPFRARGTKCPCVLDGA